MFVEFTVESVHLHYNDSGTFAKFCLQKPDQIGGVNKTDVEWTFCDKFCNSFSVNQSSTNTPKFNKHCDLLLSLSTLDSRQPFNQNDTLVVMFYTLWDGGEYLVAIFTQSLVSLFEQYHQKLHFEDKFVLHRYGKQVGDIELKFDYRLKEKH